MEKEFKPSSFMRMRRPHEFSDSKYSEKTSISKDFLDYHLETLTSRKQEYLFENFCLELCQKEICPNLIPQTGPVGGGDSKRDTENYPVSEEISFHYYYAVPSNALRENWAFAFSAKKTWKSKVESDVAKISNLVRRYDLIYFISNQSISDKKRANAEDELKKKYGIETRILDRNWIIDKVIKNKREELLVEHLSIDLPEQAFKISGEEDIIKKKKLDDLKIKIAEPNNYINREFLLVEDFIRAAKLARSLEAPRFEFEGYIDQAIRIANKISLSNQVIRAIYQKAWTLFWWYDDPDESFVNFKEFETLVYNSSNSYEYELLGNILISLNSFYFVKNEKEKLTEIHKKIEDYLVALKKLFNDATKPSNTNKAKSLYYTFKIFLNPKDEKIVKEALKKLNSILENSDQLLHFDVLTIVQIFDELGQAFEQYAEFDDLFNTICNITKRRSGEVETGKLYLSRGISNYNNKNYSAALKYFELARVSFIKEETIDELIKCSILTSFVYKKLDLNWAARKELIFSINHLLFEFSTYGNLSEKLLNCYLELIWIELIIGRVPVVLLLIQHILALDLARDLKKEDVVKDTLYHQDLVFSLLLLKSNVNQLKSIANLVHLLEQYGLFVSSLALQYALGYTKEEIGDIPISENLDNLFANALKQPAYTDLPSTPEFHLQKYLQYSTIILGCEILIKFENSTSSLEFAEDLLGGIESFFASVNYKDLLITKSRIVFKIKESDFVNYPGSVFTKEEEPEILLTIPKDISAYQSSEDQSKFKDYILECIVTLFSQGVYPNDGNLFAKIKKMALDGSLSRTLNVSPSYLFNNNIFGSEKKYNISDWLKNFSENNYILKRTLEWFEELPSELIPNEIEKAELSLRKNDIVTFRHKEMLFIDNLISEKLWEGAKWNGMLYLVPEKYDTKYPPKLGFSFSNQESATRLFIDLHKQVTNIDKDDLIQISFIDNINKVGDYIVLFTVNLENYFSANNTQKRFFAVKQRMQVFPKKNKKVFDLFKDAYNDLKEYEIFPAVIQGNKYILGEGLSLRKKKLTIIDAKDVKQNTFEYGVLELYKNGKLT